MGAWGKSDMLKLLSRTPYAEHRQSAETWRVFWRTRFPPFLRDFIFSAPWRKLKVGERLMHWTHEPHCPICHELETIDHSPHACRFHSLILDVIDKCWPPVMQYTMAHSSRSLPVALLLATPMGIMLWAACAAHWALRCAVRQNMAVPTFDSFFNTWVNLVDKVAGWEGLAHLSQPFLSFKHALTLLKTGGSLPDSKIQISKPEPTTPEKERK